MQTVTIKQLIYAGFSHCYCISNGTVEAIVTTEVGPRILCLRCCGNANMFFEAKSQAGQKNQPQYMIYGGHRLWHTPEQIPRTYENDTTAIQFSLGKASITLTQPMEPNTHIIKEIEISLTGEREFTVQHRLTNGGVWPIETSAWALSMMAPGGTVVIPQSRQDTGLLPNRTLTLWPYTKLNDARLTLWDDFLVLRQNPKEPQRFKIGVSNDRGFSCYFNHNQLFILRQRVNRQGEYADNNSSFECFVNDLFVEMETLGETQKIAPGQTICHGEQWILCADTPVPRTQEEFEQLPEIKTGGHL